MHSSQWMWKQLEDHLPLPMPLISIVEQYSRDPHPCLEQLQNHPFSWWWGVGTRDSRDAYVANRMALHAVASLYQMEGRGYDEGDLLSAGVVALYVLEQARD